MQKRWKTNVGCVYNLAYHIIWCPKYRKRGLVGDLEKRLKELLFQKAKENDWQIDNMEVMPDHVHIFIKTTPSDSPALVAAQLKGFTSHQLRKEFTCLRSKLPTLWTRSYYAESVGHISEDTIKKYIDEQKLK
jgi:putative transposase